MGDKLIWSHVARRDGKLAVHSVVSRVISDIVAIICQDFGKNTGPHDDPGKIGYLSVQEAAMQFDMWMFDI